MKKYIAILIGILLFIPCNLYAKTNKMNIYLFYGKTCPHCHELIDFLDEYLEENDNVILNKYEVWNDTENEQLLNEIEKITDVEAEGVPYLVIGEKVIIGYSETSQEEIINTIEYYLNINYEDKVGYHIENRDTDKIENKKEESNIEEKSNANEEENLILNSSLPSNIKNLINDSSNILKTIILGLISSFSLSSIWLLLFILSFISLFKDKNIKITLSIIFLVILFIFNLIYVSNIFDNTYLLSKTTLIRAIISISFSLYGTIKLTRFINNKKDKNNKILIYSILSIFFILLNVLFIYSNISIPTLFTQLSFSNNYLYTVIYSLCSILLFTLILVLYILLSKTKFYKNNQKYFFIVSSIIIIVLSMLITYKPLIFF